MKKAILLFVLLVAGVTVYSQNCMPDLIYADSGVGIFPGPFSDDNPDGGITVPACINEPYEFTLTVKVPPTFEYNGLVLDLYSVSIATSGAVPNLPEGLSYVCNPPSCFFTPDDDLGCIAIKGTPTSANAPGDFDLIIEDVVLDNSLVTLTLDFPNVIIPGADGQYLLELKPEGECGSVATENLVAKAVQMEIMPNPASSWAFVQLFSEVEGEFDLRVQDILGNTLQSRTVRLNYGDNQLEIDGGNLPNGMYNVVLSNQRGYVSQKLLISK
jgi:hypothetical protein